MQTPYKYTIYTVLVLLAAISAVAVFKVSNPQIAAQSVVPSYVPVARVAGASTSTVIKPKPVLSMPISGGLTRVSKKPFGLYVSPENSPVENDIFAGFHTGIDFETSTSEQNTEVAISAACEGQVLLKAWAKGYGGVLVQACKINGEDVTVIYGHLKLESIATNVGQTLLPSDIIGNLGQGFTRETDGRRKHLHFDIHKGTELNIHGYVAKQADLSNWIDPTQYLE